ncbi:MAG: O-antigen ligase domain-containing protein, partial [Acidobacteria bacterium]
MVAPRWIPTLCIVLLVGGALLAALLFGAVGELPLPRGGPRLDVRHLFEAFVLACAAVALLAAPAERRPRGVWFAATLALPAWAALSLLPLPVGVLEHLAPARAGIVQAAPPGPLEGCDGPLIGPGPPAAATLTSDATLTRQQTFHYAAGALAFLAAFSYFPGRRRRLLALTVTLAALGLAESVYGLWQWASGTPMVLWQEKTAYVDSATGTLINRNHFAQLVYVGLAATLALLFRPRPAGTDPVGRERAMALRVALGLAVATELAAILASRSRAGLGCAALVLAAGGIAWVRRHGRLRLFELVLAAAIFLPLAVVTVPPVVERLAALPAEWTAAAGRGEVYRTSMRIVAEHPLFGTGAGTFALIWGRYRPPAIQGAYNYAHNDYLQVLIETGIPGLLAALAPIVLFAVVTWRRRRTQPLDDPVSLPLFAALGAVALHEVIDFGLQIPSNLVLVGLLAGALAPPPLVSTAGRGGRVAVAVAVLALLLAPLAALHSLARWPGLGERVP